MLETTATSWKYSRDDEKRVEALLRDLDEFGHNVWYDDELTGGGALGILVLLAV
jgi:hypothetical protein